MAVFVHGGGFLYGSKSLASLFCQCLASRGFVVFCPNYRLAFGDVFVPDQVADVLAALRWVAGNAKRFNADVRRAMLVGDSVGAWLATMSLLVSGSGRLQEAFCTDGSSLQFKMLATHCGYMELGSGLLPYWALRQVVLQHGYRMQEYFRCSDFSRLAELEDLPFVHVTSCDGDPLRPMSRRFALALEQRSIPSLYKVFTGSGRKLIHSFGLLQPTSPSGVQLLDEICSLARKCFD
jgi:acetyl esterase/lipase